MPVVLTPEALRKMLPRAPQGILDAFIAKQDILTKAGVNQTRTRMAYFWANIEHECGGFTIKNLTENINYTAQRMHEVWPNRFSSAAAVVAKYGSAPGWQLKAFDDIYGSRMGNRPGTRDGSTFIGHGGPQWTGREGHEALARILKDLIPGLKTLAAEEAIAYAIDHSRQPEVCAAFWIWKGLNRYADAGDFKGCVKAWNGGTNGLADRLALMAGNDPIIQKLAIVEAIKPIVRQLPGAPDTATPPADVVNGATRNARTLRSIFLGGGTAAGANEAAKQGTIVPHVPAISSAAALSITGIAVAIAIAATVVIARRKAAVAANWF